MEPRFWKLQTEKNTNAAKPDHVAALYELRQTDQFADFVNGLCGKCIAFNFEALQVFGHLHLKPQNLLSQVGFLKQRHSGTAVFRLDQCFQNVVQVSFNPFTQHKPMVTLKFRRMVTRPQNQDVCLCDHNQFFICSSTCDSRADFPADHCFIFLNFFRLRRGIRL